MRVPTCEMHGVQPILSGMASPLPARASLMRLHAVSVGLPRTTTWKNRTVTTGIFKSPVAGDVQVRRLNLDGDRQADLAVHGGEDKAVYAYPLEHYAAWREAMPGVEFTPSAFGENLTTEGLLEAEVEIGDRFRIGTAEFEAAQPRMPCYKLGIRFGRDDIVRRFVQMRAPGIYLRVRREGVLRAGAEITALERSGSGLTVREVFDLLLSRPIAPALRERVMRAKALPSHLREHLLGEGGAEEEE